MCENKIVCQYDYDEHILQMDVSPINEPNPKDSKESYSDIIVKYNTLNEDNSMISNQLRDLDRSAVQGSC